MLRSRAPSAAASGQAPRRMCAPPRPGRPAAAATTRQQQRGRRPARAPAVAARAALLGLGKAAAAKKAAAAAAAAAAATPDLLPPDAAFAAATFCVVGLYALALAAPYSRPSRALFLDRPLLAPALLGAAYLALAWQAVRQEGALARLADAARACLPAPEPAALAAVFRDRALTAMAWLHLLAVDLVSAGAVLRDGLSTGVPVRHSVALCLMFGPLGLLSHSATRAGFAAWRRRRSRVGGGGGGGGAARSASPL